MSVAEAIERFLKSSRQPVLIEPGDDPLPIAPDSFAVTARGERFTIECWSQARNLVRRVRGIILEKRGRLELEVEHFGARTGTLTLLDLADPSNRTADRAGARLKYREQFRISLRRQFPDWRIAELSTAPDLHHSLSPAYPRALLRKGNTALAAIGAAAEAWSPEGALSFGIIWLDYLRRRETRLHVEGLAIVVPAGAEAATCHRVRYLHPSARYVVFVHHRGQEDSVNPGDYTNFETRLDACRQSLSESTGEIALWVDHLAHLDAVERRDRSDGSVSLAVNGLEFARAAGDSLLFGIDQKHPASAANLPEISQLAAGLARMRTAPKLPTA